MKIMDENKMTGDEYYRYIITECKRQWHENQEETYGAWESQPKSIQESYFNQMYDDNMVYLGNAAVIVGMLANIMGSAFATVEIVMSTEKMFKQEHTVITLKNYNVNIKEE